MGELKQNIEAILFAAGRTVPLKELQELVRSTPKPITDTVAELQKEYNDRQSPMMIVEENNGWKITVRESFLPIVHRINPHTELSKTILETLAVVARKQPALQSEIIKVRTNKAYDHIDELEKLGFIMKGRFGRSYRLKVTQKFMEYFDLPNDKAVKELFGGFKDIEVAVQKKVDDFEKQIPEADKEFLESKTPDQVDARASEEFEEESGLKTYADSPSQISMMEQSKVQIYSEETKEKVAPDVPIESKAAAPSEEEPPKVAAVPVKKKIISNILGIDDDVVEKAVDVKPDAEVDDGKSKDVAANLAKRILEDSSLLDKLVPKKRSKKPVDEEAADDFDDGSDKDSEDAPAEDFPGQLK